MIPVVNTEILIRRPCAEVFNAFADPDVTSRFWFTKSTGKMVAGAQLTWSWEMYGVSGDVRVKEVVPDSRIVFDWNEGRTTVEFDFRPWGDGMTHMTVKETGMTGTLEEMVAYAADSTGGFTWMLSAAKALLEQDVQLNTVRDAHPELLKPGW
ncbi:SRPBCC family protein [Fodinicola acaciae]|uniref:SRPBCC family protein n=1 Tax=Fodinicola acaciae TaxID=2681555 RepID=UPI0013D1017D|nr:SRPBCC family protein [Fodinicola acaciae]